MSKNKMIFLSIGFLLIYDFLAAQCDRWQQEVNYKMEIDFFHVSHRYAGRQWVALQNNSPDTLHHLYFHLYLNAFQPGSNMDMRSLTILDPDQRVGERINRLQPDEIGFQRIQRVRQDDAVLRFETFGTIARVELIQPIPPGQPGEIYMEYDAQVPIQVRRTGRMNNEGIHYSMAQWYPKLCQYDEMGWHTNPYISREFYGIFGSFDVTIKIDRKYTLAASGYLQNPDQIGKGYSSSNINQHDDDLVWHFKADQVHDFMWAADPEYKHTTLYTTDSILLRFFYRENERTESWKLLPAAMKEAFSYIQKHFGPYPYKEFAFVQGGDGGMEYPMSTLITGHRNLHSLVGVSVHELMHSWYHGVLATNESLYFWMDEGFTVYASQKVMDHLINHGFIPGAKPMESLFGSSQKGYLNMVEANIQEPLSTHADHFERNASYGISAYSKGAIYLDQLGYVIGDENLEKVLLTYYDRCKFTHPNPNDFRRIAEQVSGLELKWYNEYWIYTTKSIDYAIDSAFTRMPNTTDVILSKEGQMPMPLDVLVTLKSGETLLYNIPVDLMLGEKPQESYADQYIQMTPWKWTYPKYILRVNHQVEEILSIEIDPRKRMADINRGNNLFKTAQ